MRYVLKQKLLSFADDYYIRDESGADIYYVDGKVFSIGNKLSFQDLQGHELAYIRQHVLSLTPTYEIFRDGKLAAKIQKHLFALIHHRFSVDVPGPDDLEAEGNFFDHEYVFRRGGTVVATVSKQWFTFADTYGIEIADGEDEILILASAVVVDEACHPDGGGQH